MSTTDRVVSCAESPMLTDAIATAEQVMQDMNRLHTMPNNVSAAMMQKLNYNMHQAQAACQEAFATIKAK